MPHPARNPENSGIMGASYTRPEDILLAIKNFQQQVQEILKNQPLSPAAENKLQKVHDRLFQKIEETTAAHHAMAISYQSYQNLLEFEPDTYLETDPGYIIRDASTPVSARIGSPPPAVIGKSLSSLVSCEEWDRWHSCLTRVHGTGAVVSWKGNLLSENGTLFPVDVRICPVYNPRSDLTSVRFFFRNIPSSQDSAGILQYAAPAEQPPAEKIPVPAGTRTLDLKREVIELRQTAHHLKSSLEEKDLLLRETHHRVKNNLQIIASLLSLQSRYVRDERILNVLRDSQSRIKVMALVHEKLYRSEDVSTIDLSDYLRFLVSNLFKSYDVSPQMIRSTLEVKEIMVDINSAVSIGLIVNELVSNSIKYAFPKGEKGGIAIMGTKENSDIVLTVSDTGTGLPAGYDWNVSESLGLRIVNTLVEQLDGSITHVKGKGTKFRIVFPEKTKPEAPAIPCEIQA